MVTIKASPKGRRPYAYSERIPGENHPVIDLTMGLYRGDDLIVLKSADCPAVLIECGVIKNSLEELEFLATTKDCRIAHCIAICAQRFAEAKAAD